MISNTEFALMSGAAYESTRDVINQIPGPTNWLAVKHETQNSGFEAIAFVRDGTTLATSTEIVISYAGTNPADLSGDIAADLALAAGSLSVQLRQAADYYLQVRKTNPGATISFTGHSLGGGLAALMAVFFDESAATFDQAPFLRSALWQQQGIDTNGNTIPNLVAADLLTYLRNEGIYTEQQLAKLKTYVDAANPANTSPIAADTLAGRGQKVSNINVDGEFLTSWFMVPSSNRIGTQGNIANSHDGLGLLGGIELHSQALLTAFLQSDPNAATNPDTNAKTLNRVTFKLPDLLKMVFDKNLFAYDPNNKDNPLPNFLERLVKHQAGIGTSLPADDMVKRFTADLWQLAQEGGLTLTDGNQNDASAHKVSNALIAFAMQYYYEDTDNAKDSGKKLFTDAGTNGIRFDLRDVSKDIAAAIDQMNAGGDDVDLAVKKDGKYLLKGYESLKAYLNSDAFTAEERGQITYLLPYLRDWTIQAGSGGMTATDTQNRGAFMLGGNGADTLTGGTADDLLVGNRGDDTLNGGEGRDILLGGTGNDTLKGDAGVDQLVGGADNDSLDGSAGNDLLQGGTGQDAYAFTGDYGVDIITDSDGSGSIIVDGQTLGSAAQRFESVYKDDASGQTFVKLNGGQNLVILKEDSKNRTLVTDWPAAGTLGINLQDKAAEVPDATLSCQAGAMLRSTGKNGQNCESLLKQSCREGAANDHAFRRERSVA